MGFRKEQFTLGENAYKPEAPLSIERNATYVLELYVNLPDQGLGLTSSKTIDSGVAHIRENINDAEPALIMGTGVGQSYMTITRPTASQVKIRIELDHDTTLDLDLSPPRRIPTPQRYDQPGQGVMDVKLVDTDGNHYYVFRAAVRTIYGVTREGDE